MLAEGAEIRRWTMREEHLSELERSRWRFDILTIAICLGALAVPWLLLWHFAPDSWRTWYLQEGALATLLQVVPATIVAVFIFAAGAVFVMAQIIGPTLGSRAIEALIVRRRARACVIAGAVLLLACLALTALARIRDHPPELWEASAASALALASLVYVPFSIWCIGSVLRGFISPGVYSTLLSQQRGRRHPLTPERAYRRLRALRQWLRTACRVGESRDVVFALYGFQKLLGYYCDVVRNGEHGRPPNKALRRDAPAEYSSTREIVHSSWWILLDPRRVLWNDTSRFGWFGDEFGRALARCAEIGIRSGLLLRRDLDRLLVVMGGATLQLAGFKTPENGAIGLPQARPLPEEAGFLLDRIAEIGMYAFHVEDKAYSDWFVRPAMVLASLENKLEELDAQATDMPLPESGSDHAEHQNKQEYCLAARSLAAWCLVNYAFQQPERGAKDTDEPQGGLPVHGWRRLGKQAKSHTPLWDEARRLAISSAIHPSWMAPIQDEPDGDQRLNTFLDEVRAEVAAKHLEKPRPPVASR
jgi:hypothetical protein